MGIRGKRACIGILLCATTATAQNFTTLVNFNGFPSSGASPVYVSLVQGVDGNFYGTTVMGGANNYGTVFRITPAGALTTLHSFNSSDGANPNAGLIQTATGDFYGTASLGGAHNWGTIYKVTSSGTLTTVHSFDLSIDGANPNAGLVQATDGSLYGTTTIGGGNGFNGTVFKFTPRGLTTLHRFAGTDGANPYGGLVQTTDGTLYGTTYGGGANNYGAVFKITPAGLFTSLHSFDCTDGCLPNAGLIQATNGDFYGTTVQGGSSGYGTVFTITPAGALTTLHSFNLTDGRFPAAPLVKATDMNFYGTTSAGGAHDWGTIFKITSGGTLTTLHSFDFSTDGANPLGGLVQGTDGNFYGTTQTGESFGTVFSLSVGLGPCVKTLPTSGKVGAAVKILGTDLTGATSVTFHGLTATFTVVSPSELSTTVPAGATTGKLQVTTPGGTLLSNVVFRVAPVIASFSPTSGSAGAGVIVTGESFRGATSVWFGGVRALSFAVNSETQISATVPAGAKTGRISVITPGGTAASADIFTVD